MADGVIVYRGPSALDGAPIVAIATNLWDPPRNHKIGNVVQVWILREDISPVEAAKSGGDASICGDCALRGTDGTDRLCYVLPFQAPLSVWKAYRRGAYRDVPLEEAAQILRHARRPIRIGAYGDPAALPLTVVQMLATAGPRRLGYSHQWRQFPALREYVMASVDTIEEAQNAHRMGFRTFRTGADATTPMPGEIVCPGSAEVGLTTCDRCGLCDGARTTDRRANIRTMPHGVKAVKFFATRTDAVA